MDPMTIILEVDFSTNEGAASFTVINNAKEQSNPILIVSIEAVLVVLTVEL